MTMQNNFANPYQDFLEGSKPATVLYEPVSTV